SRWPRPARPGATRAGPRPTTTSGRGSDRRATGRARAQAPAVPTAGAPRVHRRAYGPVVRRRRVVSVVLLLAVGACGGGGGGGEGQAEEAVVSTTRLRVDNESVC